MRKLCDGGSIPVTERFNLMKGGRADAVRYYYQKIKLTWNNC